MLHGLVKFLRDDRGSTLIETAFVAPILIAMTLSGVEISNIVARQTEMQTIAANAMEIVIAAAPSGDTEEARTISDTKAYIARVSGLTAVDTMPNAGEVNVYKRYRCGNNSERQAIKGCANEAQTESEFIVIYMKDRYSPIWNNYGFGEELVFDVKRSVQIR